MVVRLEGKIEGKPIIFTRRDGDWWETTIPGNLSGVYIVELTAIDAAGNTAFCARYIVTVDLSALCVHLEPFPWKAELLPLNYYATLMKTERGGMRR